MSTFGRGSGQSARGASVTKPSRRRPNPRPRVPPPTAAPHVPAVSPRRRFAAPPMAACARALVHVHELAAVGVEERLPGSVRSHRYANQVQVFSPAGGGRRGALECPAFTVATIRPEALLHEHFLRDYVQRGSVSVMTTGAAAERHNALCVAGGMLHLFVDAETYRRLGLDGVASGVHPSGQFFRVQVDLRADGFRSGNRAYDRAHWCLTRMQQVRVLASHSEGGGACCGPVRFAADLCTESRVARCRASSCTVATDTRTPTPQALSALAATDAEGAAPAEAMWDLLEWLGFVHGDMGTCIGAGAPVEEFATHLKSPQVLDCTPGAGVVRQVRGFLAPPTVSRLLSATIEEVRSGQLPWASVVVWGFEDAPLSWGSSAHCFADGELVRELRLARTREQLHVRPCEPGASGRRAVTPCAGLHGYLVAAGSGDNHTAVVVLPGGAKALAFDLISGRDEHG
jgi:ribonuclease P/MRP protein subunit RPP40